MVLIGCEIRIDSVVWIDSQFLSGGGGFFHAMSFFEQLKELLHGDSGIRRPTERKDFPQQDPK